MPKRIQRKRTKGWRMPPNTVYVGRGSKWGNPFVIGEPCGIFKNGEGMRGMAETLVPALSREQVIEFYDAVIGGMIGPDQYPTGHTWRDSFIKRHRGEWPQYTARRELRGKDLACWCPLDQPCHADVLLELANR